LKSYDRSKSRCPIPLILRTIAGISVLCSLVIVLQGQAPAATISGESETIFRMQKINDRNLYPLYEYFRLSGSDDVGERGTLSINAGAWGRADFRDRSGDSNPYGDLQYGYVSYGGNKDNVRINAGRQFIAEGVATERLDGLYLRSDLAAGFGAAAFVGSPVVTQSNFKGGDITYGGRVSQGNPKYYSVGLSALKTDYDNSRIREEQGIDIWAQPLRQVDLSGRSSYNSITSGWMEHAYTVTVTPLDKLRFTANLSKINYKDYFYQVTTSALSLTNGLLNPQEDVLSLGGSIEYMPTKSLRVVADYKNYDYAVAGQAKYYGGKATFSLPESYGGGLSYHRMEGEVDKLRYDEYRIFASKSIGKANITVDLFDVHYEAPINGRRDVYAISAAVGYEVTPALQVSGDVEYSRSTDSDSAVAGLLKLVYRFDMNFGAEGRSKQ
jgi:hypothetical protein